MDLEEVTGSAVAARIDQLRGRFESVPVERTEWRIDAAEYDRTVRRFEAGSVGGAGAWVTRVGDRGTEALMVRHAGEPGWSEPAGKHEPGESLVETAVRETREETGVECAVTDVLRAERALHVCDEADRDPLHRLVLVFAADYVAGEAHPGDEAIADVGWFSEHPENLRYPAVAEFPLG